MVKNNPLSLPRTKNYALYAHRDRCCELCMDIDITHHKEDLTSKHYFFVCIRSIPSQFLHHGQVMNPLIMKINGLYPPHDFLLIPLPLSFSEVLCSPALR